MKTGTTLTILLALTAALLVGCGGGSSGAGSALSPGEGLPDDPGTEDPAEPITVVPPPAPSVLGAYMSQWINVHGAGAQRSDPKSGNPADWPLGHGLQGDEIRIYNYVRLVRDAK